MAGDDIGQRRRVAAIADVRHLESGALEEQRHRQMGDAADAAFGVAELACWGFTQAMNSATVLAGTSLLTTSTNGLVPTTLIGAKSFWES